MCTSLTYEHDECKLALQDQLSHNEKLLLQLREREESLQGKEKDLSFSQTAVSCWSVSIDGCAGVADNHKQRCMQKLNCIISAA